MTPGLMTQSILMDGKKHIRTFQNKGTDWEYIKRLVFSANMEMEKRRFW